MSRVLAIFGPTASGKTDVAEAIADRVPAELVSADAMQAYRGLPILTNQSEHPTALVGVWPLSHDGSLAEYQELAHRAVDAALAAGRTPVVVGGTGLYLRAAVSDLELPPPPAPGAPSGGTPATRSSAPRARTPSSRPSTPRRPPTSIRTIAAASSARSSSPRLERR